MTSGHTGVGARQCVCAGPGEDFISALRGRATRCENETVSSEALARLEVILAVSGRQEGAMPKPFQL